MPLFVENVGGTARICTSPKRVRAGISDQRPLVTYSALGVYTVLHTDGGHLGPLGPSELLGIHSI
jgi:hypothetical protein